MQAHRRALEASGYASLLVHSGSLLEVFEDDRTYPFEAHAPFKVWVPLADAPDSFVWFEPGSRPRLLLNQPQDYWYKSAQIPEDYWVPHFDVRSVPDRDAARAQLPRDLSGCAYIGDAFAQAGTWGLEAINPPALMRRLDYARAAKTPYELVCLREASRLGALGHEAAAGAFRAGASEFEIELAFLEACGLREQELPYNPIIALNEGGAVLHYQVLGEALPAGALLAPDRRRRGVRRLRQRHHPHLRGRGPRLCRSHRPHGQDAAGAVRRGPPRG